MYTLGVCREVTSLKELGQSQTALKGGGALQIQKSPKAELKKIAFRQDFEHLEQSLRMILKFEVKL